MEGFAYEPVNPGPLWFSKPPGSPVALTDASVRAPYKQIWTGHSNLLNAGSATGSNYRHLLISSVPWIDKKRKTQTR